MSDLQEKWDTFFENAREIEADARRWRRFMDECSNNGIRFGCPWAETDPKWDDPQAAIDAELLKEAK